MFSDACRVFECQEPRVVRNVHTGEEQELLCWDWPREAEEQVATLKDGTRVKGTILAQHWEVKACRCGEAHPAEHWPYPVFSGFSNALQKSQKTFRTSI